MVGRFGQGCQLEIYEGALHVLGSVHIPTHLGIIILILQLKKKDSERVNNIGKVTMAVLRDKLHI